MIDGAPAHTVLLVASVPRSGGTWLFNALRLLLVHAGEEVHARWVDDYDRDARSRFHLVKAHEATQIHFSVNRVFTTRRDLAERLASLVRMGWVADDPGAIIKAAHHQRQLYAAWNARSDLEVLYSDIAKRPGDVLALLASYLDIRLEDPDVGRLADMLRGLRVPSGEGYDPVTLLHPRHRADPNVASNDVARIRRLLEGVA